MDFHSLSRKELQTLCKKNKIPANITNVAMADALAALHQVEGLDEFLNPMGTDAQQFHEEKVAGTPDIHRTACRTSTRRKAVREEPENAEGAEQENKDVNVPVTPAMQPSSRRRAPAVYTRRKKEPQMPEDEKDGGKGKPTGVPKTPAAPSNRTRAPDGTSVQRAYSTRRSVRLLEKSLSKMSLMDTEDMGLAKIGDISEEMSNVSQQTEDSADTEKGASLQTVSTVVSEKTGELEVSSPENITISECQSHDSDSEKQLGSGAENDVGANLQAELQEEPQEGSGKINYLVEAEPHDSNLKLEGSSETQEGLGKINYLVEAEPHDSNLKLEGSSETQEGLGKINYLKDEPNDSNLKLEGSSETYNDSNEACECCDESVDDLSKSTGKAEHVENEAGSELEHSCDSSEPETKKLLASKQDDAVSVEVSEVAFMEVTDQDVAALSVEETDDASMEVTDQDVAGALPMSSLHDNSVSLKELVECNIDNHGSNDGDDNQEKNIETEHWKVVDGNGNQNFGLMFNVDGKAADEKDLASPEGILDSGSSNFCSFGEHQEELEAKAAEHSEESRAEIEKMLLDIEKDASSENTIAVIQANIESSADENKNVENVTLESSLLDVDVHKADDQKDNSETLEPKAQPEESKEYRAAEDALMSELSCNTNNTLVDNNVIPEEIAMPKQEYRISAETMTVAPIYEQRTSDIPIQSIVADQLKGGSPCPAQSEPKEDANEIQTIPKMSTDDLQKRSMRKLKKMLKSLTLDGKPNSKTNNVAKEEVERKRIALQALPENQMTTGEAQNDG